MNNEQLKKLDAKGIEIAEGLMNGTLDANSANEQISGSNVEKMMIAFALGNRFAQLLATDIGQTGAVNTVAVTSFAKTLKLTDEHSARHANIQFGQRIGAISLWHAQVVEKREHDKLSPLGLTEGELPGSSQYNIGFEQKQIIVTTMGGILKDNKPNPENDASDSEKLNHAFNQLSSICTDLCLTISGSSLHSPSIFWGGDADGKFRAAAIAPLVIVEDSITDSEARDLQKNDFDDSTYFGRQMNAADADAAGVSMCIALMSKASNDRMNLIKDLPGYSVANTIKAIRLFNPVHLGNLADEFGRIVDKDLANEIRTKINFAWTDRIPDHVLNELAYKAQKTPTP